jgi:hypothetical protein
MAKLPKQGFASALREHDAGDTGKAPRLTKWC